MALDYSTKTIADKAGGDIPLKLVTDGSTYWTIRDTYPSLIKIQLDPTMTASLYAENRVLGGKMTLANAARLPNAGGFIRGVRVYSDGTRTQNDLIRIIVYDADFTSAPVDGAAWSAVNSADIGKQVCELIIPEWTQKGGRSFATIDNIAVAFTCQGSANDADKRALYAIAYVDTQDDAGITFAAINDLTFVFLIDRE